MTNSLADQALTIAQAATNHPRIRTLVIEGEISKADDLAGSRAKTLIREVLDDPDYYDEAMSDACCDFDDAPGPLGVIALRRAILLCFADILDQA